MSVTEKVFRTLQINRVNLHEPPKVPHRQRVTRMYKAILKNTADWAIFRDVWLSEATKIQKIFRERSTEVDPRKIEGYLSEGEKYLEDSMHPDPYTPIYMPGGSLYQRNEPFPDYILKDDAHVDYYSYTGLDALDTLVNWGERGLASMPWRTQPAHGAPGKL